MGYVLILSIVKYIAVRIIAYFKRLQNFSGCFFFFLIPLAPALDADINWLNSIWFKQKDRNIHAYL